MSKWNPNSKVALAVDSLPATITLSITEYEQLKHDAERYRWLRDNNFNHLYLTHNENAASYLSATEEIEGNPDWYDDEDHNEIEKMKATNTIWSFQYYPDTPIGFYKFSGSSLDYVIDQAMKDKP